MKKILLFTLLALSFLSVRAQNPLVGKPSLKLVFDAAQTKKWEWIVDTNNGLTINGTGGTPTITYSDFNGTGTSLSAFNASGVLTRITNGSNGQYLTLTAGVPTWATLNAVSFGLDNEIPFTNSTVDDFDYSSTFTFDGSLFSLRQAMSDATIHTFMKFGDDTDGHTGEIRYRKEATGTSGYTFIGPATINEGLRIYGSGQGHFFGASDQLKIGSGSALTINASTSVARTITMADPGANDSFAYLAATQTLTNKTLTSPTISGGTINNAVIGATTPSTGAFTTGVFNSGEINPYLFTNRGSVVLALQAQTSAQRSSLELYTKDGDGTDDLIVSLYAKGFPSDIANRETLNYYYNSASTRFELASLAAGTGTVRPIHLYTGANTSQLILNTDATVRMSSLAGTGSDIVYADTEGDLVRSTVEISSVVAATEGTYVPSIRWFGGSAGITYSTQTGYYVKNGKSVTFSATIVVTDKGSDTGGLYMTIPVAARASSPAFQYVMFYGTEMVSVFDRDYLVGQIGAGASELTVVTATNNTTPAGIDAASFDGLPFTVRVSGTYIVD